MRREWTRVGRKFVPVAYCLREIVSFMLDLYICSVKLESTGRRIEIYRRAAGAEAVPDELSTTTAVVMPAEH